MHQICVLALSATLKRHFTLGTYNSHAPESVVLSLHITGKWHSTVTWLLTDTRLLLILVQTQQHWIDFTLSIALMTRGIRLGRSLLESCFIHILHFEYRGLQDTSGIGLAGICTWSYDKRFRSDDLSCLSSPNRLYLNQSIHSRSQ